MGLEDASLSPPVERHAMTIHARPFGVGRTMDAE
jgi:hypothetical protein